MTPLALKRACKFALSISELLLRLNLTSGTLTSLQWISGRAWCYASLVPTKDMELVVHGAKLSCPAFQFLLHAALRTLIDQLGSATFNVGIFNLRCEPDLDADGPEGTPQDALDQRPPIVAR